jgi:2'-5' RNA ligase
VRAFLAVPLTPPALDAGVQLLDRLRTALPDVRWVRSEGLHLTLHFFEHLDEDDAPGVVDAATKAAVRATPYVAQLGGLGSFPREGDERVLWIGMRQGISETVALQAGVEKALADKGFPGEQRAFKPHLTLGRPRMRFNETARRRWQRFSEHTLPEFTVGEVCLYRSHPGPGGSRYEVVAQVPLSASP